MRFLLSWAETSNMAWKTSPRLVKAALKSLAMKVIPVASRPRELARRPDES
jgi:hypothetical protein